MSSSTTKTDFSQGSVWRNIVAQAVPLTIAQFVHLLYNVVDRIYIGHMSEGHGLALTGVGLTFPIITLIMAFTALFGMGGLPLFAMARGEGEPEKAESILGNSCALLLVSSVILTAVGYLFCRPILFAFGASEASFVYAKAYLDIYLIGTVFSMLATGLNGYINAQGFPRTGMMSISLGALINIALDPLFIFGLKMGVAGAALATVISQAFSALFVLHFLLGKRAVVPLRLSKIRIGGSTAAAIVRLGTVNFIMQGTNCLVQIACNTTLQRYGGDLYVGVMTVTNSVREIFMLPISGISSGSAPVISYNFGAGRFDRVREAINFTTVLGFVYSLIAWVLVFFLPRFWFGIFSSDQAILDAGVSALRIYFFGYVFMALQFAGQTSFQSLGDARHAIFFSLLRKAFIVIPLTLLLPRFGFGVNGVFIAEPVSNVVGGLACFLTMRMTIYRHMESFERPSSRL